MKSSAVYRVSAPPHLRHQDSAFKIFWTQAAALLPVLIVSMVLFPIESAVSLALIWITANITEFLCSKIFKNPFRIFDISTFVISAIYFLLLPAAYPPVYMMLGISIGIFGRELFGGKNGCFVHPALLGNVFLQLSFPVFFRLGSGTLFIDSGGIGVWLVLFALAAGSTVIMSRKLLEWELPVIYILTVLILEKLSPAGVALSIRHVIFAAFYLMIQPGTMPLTRNARRAVAFLAAFIAWVLDSVTSSAYVAVPEAFAILSMNCIAVWLDQWILPPGAEESRTIAKA